MKSIHRIFLFCAAAAAFTSCKKDSDPVINITNSASSGSERIQFNGIAGSEAGSVAGNSVYLDFSNDRTSASLRSGWDLGFYCGSDFRVILNNTTSAGAKVTNKFDLASVNTADTIGLTLSTSQFDPQPAHLAYFDNINGDLSQTVIPAVSTNDAANPVIILNRGTGGGIAARPWIKLQVLQSAGAYVVRFAGITETTFKTITVTKDAAYNFRFVSLDNNGSIVTVEPEKAKWDITWSYSVFETNFGNGTVPYNFSDLISVNYLAGVQVKQKVYADAATATAAYAAFNRDSVNAPSNATATGRWTIGSSWRSTQPATGARQDRFYIIKDANGNYYKFKCLAMGVGTDGGTRGKPEFKYTLIN